MHMIMSHKSIVKINTFGAELNSFNIDGNELIWQPNQAVWHKCAPILFPVIGRLKDQKFSFNGMEYQMGKHGFASTHTFEVEKQTRNSISMLCKSSHITKKYYPFDFLLRVIFSLNDKILNVNYEVENKSKGPMYFSIGSHPGISLPLINTTLDEYYIEFEEDETLCRNMIVNDLLVLQKKLYLNNEKIIKLSKDIFIEDALVFKNIKSRAIYVKNDKTDRKVKIDIKNAPDLGIWAKPGAEYVCIEPWFGYDDPTDVSGILEEKPGILTLEPDDTFKTGYSIELL